MDGSETIFAQIFTVHEANALLPVVRPLIERILEIIRRLRARAKPWFRAEQIDPEQRTLWIDCRRMMRLLGSWAKSRTGWMRSTDTAVCVKGWNKACIDFPCMLGEEVVFLCWRLGEPERCHWHRIEDGFAGRRPLLDVEKPGPDGDTSVLTDGLDFSC